MLLTFLSGLAGTLLPSAEWLGLPASTVLRYMIGVVEKTSRFPDSQTEVIINIFMLTMSYLVLAVITLYLWLATRHDFRTKNSANII
jgi:hypothetical protein